MTHIVYPAVAERVAIENGMLLARLDERHHARHLKTGDSAMVLKFMTNSSLDTETHSRFTAYPALVLIHSTITMVIPSLA